MWATVFKTVAEAVLTQNQPKSSASSENHGHYNVQGHINHMPVDVSINRGAGNSNPSYRPPPQRSFDSQNSFGPSSNHYDNPFLNHGNNSNSGPVPSKTQRNSSYNGAKNNSNNYPTKQKTPKNNNDNKFVVADKPKTGNTNKPKNNDNTFCMVKMPSHGNFKIHIEKTGSTDSSRRVNSNSANKNDNRQENKNRQFKHQNSNQKNNTDNGQKFQQSGNNSNNRQGQNTWMYIGKLKIGTTESDLSSYLKIKFPKNQFKIHSLPLYKDGKLPCFKVQVDNAILSEFELLGNWPAGVTIKKYQHNFKA